MPCSLYAVVKEQKLVQKLTACTGKLPIEAVPLSTNCLQMVGVPGIEPGTSSLSGTRSNRLSYTPDFAEASSDKPLETSSHRTWPSRRVRSGFPALALAKAGGGNRVRTGDILLAKQVLYQLSYAPAFAIGTVWLPPDRGFPSVYSGIVYESFAPEMV